MKQSKLTTNLNPEDVTWYFRHEISSLGEEDLTCTIEGTTATLRATRWLGDEVWAEIMDYVDTFSGEWVKDGKNSHWEIDVDWLVDRVEYERFWDQYRPVLEWWIQMPRSVKEMMKFAYPKLGEGEVEDRVKVMVSTLEWMKHIEALEVARDPDVPEGEG